MQRQHNGTAGKITNCQVGVFLAYASPKGRALVDRELYLPRSWTGDQERLAGAQVPEDRKFRTKPQLLQTMIERAVAAGSRSSGSPPMRPLRAYLEEPEIPYVLAVARDHLVATPTGPRRADVKAGVGAWHRLSCGNSAKGLRWYDWALFAAGRPEVSLLARRSVSKLSEQAFYLCCTPQPVPLAVLVKVAGTARNLG